MVEELLKLKFNIIGVYMPNIKIPTFNEETLLNLLNENKNTLTLSLLKKIDVNNLSNKDISKIQFALNMYKDVIVLYDFSRGLNDKELQYFCLLFKRMSNKHNKKIILISKDMNFLAMICDTYAIYHKRVLFATHDVFDERLYNYVDYPNIVKFIKLSQKKKIPLSNTCHMSELYEDILRNKI